MTKYLLFFIAVLSYFNVNAATCNPRVEYCDRRIYITLCNDGTLSSSVGRGTCSYHGGVAR